MLCWIAGAALHPKTHEWKRFLFARDLPFKTGRVKELIALSKQLQQEWGNEYVYVTCCAPDEREMTEDEYFGRRTHIYKHSHAARLERQRKNALLAASVDEVHTGGGDGLGNGSDGEV